MVTRKCKTSISESSHRISVFLRGKYKIYFYSFGVGVGWFSEMSKHWWENGNFSNTVLCCFKNTHPNVFSLSISVFQLPRFEQWPLERQNSLSRNTRIHVETGIPNSVDFQNCCFNSEIPDSRISELPPQQKEANNFPAFWRSDRKLNPNHKFKSLWTHGPTYGLWDGSHARDQDRAEDC